ncbi:MAG: peptidoglycan DD-metalloendopeptidase family protein [Flavobacteriaceae bacterium]|jgi:murein DD-endopeptidase MepM/ murein hydrolase activator NlpD|nr:peptidoglycan DD-metalloendopeptidase family protein [Flavobacteriaceae bacterium]
MKQKTTIFFIGIFLAIFNMNAQKMNFTPLGGEIKLGHKHSVCLTDEQRQEVKEMLWESVEQLKREGKLAFSETRARGAQVLFGWPVQKAEGVTYNDVWGISGYVDHNAAYPNQLTDYNCGNRTYDTASGYNHQGVDIYTWPFGWKQMDNNQAEIIAAASGQIIAKGDGQYDRSCQFNSNPWNAVYVMHSDGSIAWYGHMKSGSLTTKPVGSFVEQGEYLGIVGSSGNSTGPHLHFEVYEDSTYTQLLDPYAGNCNNLNENSLWESQKPYINPNVNAALTHSAPPVFPTCPQTEISHEANEFAVGQMIYFAVFLRDQVAGTILNLKIIRPDNSIFENWNSSLQQNYNSSYWYWSNNTFTIEGNWKWEVTYQGQTVSHTFHVGTLHVDDLDKNTIKVYPNPFNDIVHIESDVLIKKVKVFDILGKNINTIEDAHNGIKSINLESLSDGVYFLQVKEDSGIKQTFKIVK